MVKNFLSEKDIDYLESRLRDVFITKEEFMHYKSDLFDKLDEIIKNTRNTNQEVELVEHRVSKIESSLNLPQ